MKFHKYFLKFCNFCQFYLAGSEFYKQPISKFHTLVLSQVVDWYIRTCACGTRTSAWPERPIWPVGSKRLCGLPNQNTSPAAKSYCRPPFCLGWPGTSPVWPKTSRADCAAVDLWCSWTKARPSGRWAVFRARRWPPSRCLWPWSRTWARGRRCCRSFWNAKLAPWCSALVLRCAKGSSSDRGGRCFVRRCSRLLPRDDPDLKKTSILRLHAAWERREDLNFIHCN